MPTLSLPIVSSCSVETCGFNHDGCHAGTITVAGEHAACGTYATSESHAVSPRPTAVGTCDRTNCVHHAGSACGAAAIAVAASFDTADCLTFELRA